MWVKSSRSNANGNCVEVAALPGGALSADSPLTLVRPAKTASSHEAFPRSPSPPSAWPVRPLGSRRRRPQHPYRAGGAGGPLRPSGRPGCRAQRPAYVWAGDRLPSA
ncbi:DUF397 domain-containing protein [Streptomyces achromogenes]|uniref:DUF397 domain-containing protein n=1 Tax=Streptomyces achromogenes TaxID=67255 RepID=UPI003702FBF4